MGEWYLNSVRRKKGWNGSIRWRVSPNCGCREVAGEEHGHWPPDMQSMSVEDLAMRLGREERGL